MDETRGVDTSQKAPRIDFATLGLRDALDLAVLVEEEARDRYVELAEQMAAHRTPDAARFFRFMQQNEEKHRVALATRRQALFGAEPVRVTRAMLFDVEAPEYDEVRAFMTLREALGTALRAEEKAGAFFAAALARITDPGVAELFAELAAEEVEHQRLVKVELAKAPPDPEVHPSAFSDPPQTID
ncbi:MAG: ferritin family protein [Myxococcota bacterium]